MIATVLGWVMKSKGAKLGGGLLGGGGLVALIMGLHSDVTGKIDKVESDQKQYVELALKPVQVEIEYLKKATTETKNMVRDIHNYLLKSKTK